MTEFHEYAIDYLTKKAESDRAAAFASFQLLLDKPVGIGDHSTDDFYKELDNALNKLVDAEDRLHVINEHLTDFKAATQHAPMA